MQRKNMIVPSRSDACPICGNTLWKTYDAGIIPDYGRANLFAVPCEKCREKYRATDETGIPSEYCEADLSKFNFGIYSTDTENMKKIAHDFVENFKSRWEKDKVGPYLWSSIPGSGKSFLASCLARSVMIKYDLQMRFVTTSDYLAILAEDWKRERGAEQRSEVYRQCRLLILDDIGAEKKGEWQEAELFRLINGRWNDGVVTMFTSNMPHGKLNMNSRTISRIDQASIILEMPEESIRSKKSNERQARFLRDSLGEKKP